MHKKRLPCKGLDIFSLEAQLTQKGGGPTRHSLKIRRWECGKSRERVGAGGGLFHPPSEGFPGKTGELLLYLREGVAKKRKERRVQGRFFDRAGKRGGTNKVNKSALTTRRKIGCNTQEVTITAGLW